jgi:uncharacterized protein (DUF3084 family)
MPFLALLIRYKNYAIAGVVLLALCACFFYVNHLRTENKALLVENSELTVKLDASNASIKTLQASVDDQNTAIDTLKLAADARVAAHATEIAAARAAAESYKKKASDIMHSLPNNVDKCKAANDLINQEILKNVKK